MHELQRNIQQPSITCRACSGMARALQQSEARPSSFAFHPCMNAHLLHLPQLNAVPAHVAVQAAHVVIHAGDIGHHGGTTDVLSAMYACADSGQQILAVAGNTDDGPDAASHQLPSTVLATLNGWRVLVMHIVGVPPKRVYAIRPQSFCQCRIWICIWRC